MTPERAIEIVYAVNCRLFFNMGILEECPSLDGVSLSEMLLAKQTVEKINREEEARGRSQGRGVTMTVIPDDRLIAATYVLEHYPASLDSVVAVIAGNKTKVLGVQVLPGRGCK